MKMRELWFLTLILVCCLAACTPEEVQGDGNLPAHGTELITNFVKNERQDDSGGRIVYVQDVASSESGERLWCVNVRLVNSRGVTIAPILVSQRGEEWRLDRNPEQAVYEGYGCTWPAG